MNIMEEITLPKYKSFHSGRKFYQSKLDFKGRDIELKEYKQSELFVENFKLYNSEGLNSVNSSFKQAPLPRIG